MKTTWGELTDEHVGRVVTFTRETEPVLFRPAGEDPAASVTGTVDAIGHMTGVDDEGAPRFTHVVSLPVDGFDQPIRRAVELSGTAPVTLK